MWVVYAYYQVTFSILTILALYPEVYLRALLPFCPHSAAASLVVTNALENNEKGWKMLGFIIILLYAKRLWLVCFYKIFFNSFSWFNKGNHAILASYRRKHRQFESSRITNLCKRRISYRCFSFFLTIRIYNVNSLKRKASQQKTSKRPFPFITKQFSLLQKTIRVSFGLTFLKHTWTCLTFPKWGSCQTDGFFS